LARSGQSYHGVIVPRPAHVETDEAAPGVLLERIQRWFRHRRTEKLTPDAIPRIANTNERTSSFFQTWVDDDHAATENGQSKQAST